jgi:hypothetical protein
MMDNSHKRAFELPIVVSLVKLFLRGVATLKDLQDGSSTKGLCVHRDRILVVAITSL